VYSGPVGLGTQIHDFNVHIDSNDVFWMVRVPDSAVKVDFDDAQASLQVKDLNVFDDHDIFNSLTFGLGFPGDLGTTLPVIPPVAPGRATVSFDVKWNGALAEAEIHNAGQSFQGSFFSTVTTINWSAEQPGFQFQSEAPNPATNLISVLGREKNGVFFS
jgi:hypothetical protein